MMFFQNEFTSPRIFRAPSIFSSGFIFRIFRAFRGLPLSSFVDFK